MKIIPLSLLLLNNFSHVLFFLVHVPLVVFLHYGLDVDVPLPFSQLVSLC